MFRGFVFRLFPEKAGEWTFEDRFDLVHKTIPMRKEKQLKDDNSDDSSDEDKGGDFHLSFDSDDVNIDDV